MKCLFVLALCAAVAFGDRLGDLLEALLDDVEADPSCVAADVKVKDAGVCCYGLVKVPGDGFLSQFNWCRECPQERITMSGDKSGCCPEGTKVTMQDRCVVPEPTQLPDCECDKEKYKQNSEGESFFCQFKGKEGYNCAPGSKFGGGCPKTAMTCVRPAEKEPAFKCMTREKWSDEKTKWCCENKKLGCPVKKESKRCTSMKARSDSSCSKGKKGLKKCLNELKKQDTLKCASFDQKLYGEKRNEFCSTIKVSKCMSKKAKLIKRHCAKECEQGLMTLLGLY